MKIKDWIHQVMIIHSTNFEKKENMQLETGR